MLQKIDVYLPFADDDDDIRWEHGRDDGGGEPSKLAGCMRNTMNIIGFIIMAILIIGWISSYLEGCF